MVEDDSGQAGAEIGERIEVTPAMVRIAGQIIENQFDASPGVSDDVAATILLAVFQERRAPLAKG